MSTYQESPHTGFTYVMLVLIFGTVFGFLGYAWYVTREGAVLSYMQVAGVMTFVGLMLIVQGIYETIHNNKMHRWQTCDGEVTLSEIDERSIYDDELGRDAIHFYPKIKYRYEVSNVSYEGSRIAIEEYSSTERADAWPVLHEYPVGKTVKIHYNPERAEESIIELGSKPSLIHLPSILLASFFFTFAALFANGKKLDLNMYFGPRHEEVSATPTGEETPDTKTFFVWTPDSEQDLIRYFVYVGKKSSGCQNVNSKFIDVVFMKADADNIKWCTYEGKVVPKDCFTSCTPDKLLIPSGKIVIR